MPTEKLPPGYFALPEVKQRYENRRREAQQKAEQDLHEAGLRENAFDELVCRTCNVVVEPTGESMEVKCSQCNKTWD